jgi:phosphoenolpyruvate carboxylase
MADPSKQRQKTQTQTQTTPEAYPAAPSQQQLPSGDFSYILEIVMNMQTSMGKLIEAVDALKDRAKDQDRKQEEVKNEVRGVAQDVHAAKVTLGVVGALVTAAIAVVGYIAIPLLFKIVDLGIDLLKKTH